MSGHVSTESEAATATMRAIVTQFVRAHCGEESNSYNLEIGLSGEHDGEDGDEAKDNFDLSVIMFGLLSGVEFNQADVENARKTIEALCRKAVPF